MNKAVFAFVTLAIVLFMAGFVNAGGCALSPSLNHQLMPDTDCDGIIDQLDNCPFITNPLQQDSDRNGLGNACDIYIESIGTNPANFVYNGRAFTVTTTFENNRNYNIRNMRVRILSPELGIESVQYIDNLDVCESNTAEFTLRAPTCSESAEYPLIIEATFMNEFGIQERTGGVTTIKVTPDSYCEIVLQNGGQLGNTYVNVMEIQDVYKGGEAVFPIKISNREFQDNDYVISVTGHEGWEKARLTPNSLIIVPAETDRIADLYISARQDVAPGERAFVVTIQNKEEFQRFLLIANVKEQPVEDRSVFFIFGFRMILIAALAILIFLLIVFGAAKLSAKMKRDSEKSYY